MGSGIRSYKFFIGLVAILTLVGLAKVTVVASGGSNSRTHVPDGAKSPDETELPFCSVVNPSTGAFIDLSWLSSTPNESGRHDRAHKKHKGHEQSKTRWMVRGWEYNTNFTMGICSSSVGSEIKGKLDEKTGAYYVTPDDKLVSIGQFSTVPKFTGKKLTMTYENGDLCPNGKDHKSTLIQFVCDKKTPTKAQISFVGQLHNCSYFFELRSAYACPISNVGNDINAVGIFGGIILVFLVFEVARRVVYKRLVQDRARTTSMNDNGGNYYYNHPSPRWASPEPRSAVKSLWKRTVEAVFGPGKPHSGTSLRLRSRENTGVVPAEMEQQNELLDSLDIEAASGDSLVR